MMWIDESLYYGLLYAFFTCGIAVGILLEIKLKLTQKGPEMK